MKKLYFIAPFIIQLFVRFTFKHLSRYFLHSRVTGLENLKNVKGPILLASNHLHEFDPLIIPSVIPQKIFKSPLFFVALERKYYIQSDQPVGWRSRFYGMLFFKTLGAYPIKKGVKDYEISLSRHLSILTDGGSVYIFPEGKRTSTGKIQQGHGGLGYLAYHSGATIIPVAIDGIWQMNLKSFLTGKNTLSVNIGKPIYPNELFPKGIMGDVKIYKSITEKTMTSITNMLTPYQ